jgi:hypothetical protein
MPPLVLHAAARRNETSCSTRLRPGRLADTRRSWLRNGPCVSTIRAQVINLGRCVERDFHLCRTARRTREIGFGACGLAHLTTSRENQKLGRSAAYLLSRNKINRRLRYRSRYRAKGLMVGATGFAPRPASAGRRLKPSFRRARPSGSEGIDGRGDWIRTSGLSVPNRALYQAEPRPVEEKQSIVLPLHQPAAGLPRT